MTVFVSNSTSFFRSFVRAEIQRPSGDTRGEKSPSEFGMEKTFPVVRSDRKIAIWPALSDSEKMTEFPSAVQVGSDSAVSVLPWTSNSGLPPDDESSRIFQG